MMKLEAVIQPSRFESVKDALREIGVEGMTVIEVRGHGRQKGHTEVYRGREYTVDLLPKIKIEMILPDKIVQSVVDTILRTAKTGKIGDGKTCLSRIHDALFPQSGRARKGFSLLAVGGYGRRMLFPYSDLDLLFLFEHQRDERRLHSSIAELSRNLWDLGLRVSSAGRTIEECKRIEEDNAEFHLALLDRRFMGGDRELYDSLNTRVLRSAERRAKNFLTCELARLTRERHARYGNTIFHLEPNAKEAPGGLRDFHASTWLEAIAKRGEAETRK